MRKTNISAFIFDVLLSFIGTFGIISIPLICILPEVSLWTAGILCLAASALFVCIFNMRRKSVIVGTIIVIIVTIVYIFINLNSLYRSFTYVLIQALDAIRKNSGNVISLDIVNNNLNSGYSFEYSLLIVLVIFVTLFTAIQVSFIRNMAGAIICILPMLVFFITFAVIPHLISFTMCIFFVFGAAAYKKDSENTVSGYMVIIIGIVASLFIIMCVPKKGFQRHEIFNSMYVELESLMSGTGEQLFGVNAPGGINYGQLGKINEINFTDSEMATVTTIETGRNQYFKTFTGVTYDGNQWSGNTDKEKTSVTEKVINMADSNLDIQQYLTSGYTDNYFDMVKKYKYTLYDKNAKKSTTEINYSIMHIDYEKFKNIAEKNVVFNTNYQIREANILTQDEFSKFESLYRNQIKRDYLYISNDTTQLIYQLFGSVYTDTPETKMKFIDMVKNFFVKNYTYTIKPGKVPEGRDFVEYFLQESKQGYCTYFATAAAVMFRYAGIPTRYCEGYVVTNENVVKGSRTEQEITRLGSDGSYKNEINKAYTVELTDRNAHAWVEVYMDGYGWIPVEVTPGTGSADSMTEAEMIANVRHDSTVAAEENKEDFEETTAAEETTTAVDAQTEYYSSKENNETEILSGGTGAVAGNKYVKIGIIIIGVFIGILLLVSIINFRIRIIKNNRKKYMKNITLYDRDEQIAYLYEYMLNLLRYLGYDKPESMDYEDYAAHLEEHDELLRECQIKTIMQLLLKGSIFSKTALSDEEMAMLNIMLHKLRAAVIKECKGINLLKFKYIDVL